jgi:hypothetical protein
MTPDHLAYRVETEEPSDELRDAVNTFMKFQKAPWSTMPNPLQNLSDAADLMPEGWLIDRLIQYQEGTYVEAYHPARIVASVNGRAPTEPRARTAAAIRAKGMG